jgi:hypothetical protein
MTSRSGAHGVPGSREAQKPGRLIRSAKFEGGPFPSYAMNDIAPDVAGGSNKWQAILPRSLPATLKRTRSALQGDRALCSSSRCPKA